MKEITFAPAYVAFYPMLAEIARECGYSLSVHGTVGRDRFSDLDLVATPWIEECEPPNELMKKITHWLVRLLNARLVDSTKGLDPQIKPHGRLAYRIPCGNGASIDISVIPPRNNRGVEGK